MNSWILSIVGIVCVGVIVDIILPNGQTSKYIKVIFSLFTVFVIIFPISNFAKSDFNLNNLFEFSNYEVDYNFISSVNISKCESVSKMLADKLVEDGINVAQINVACDNFNEKFQIMSIDVTLKKESLNLPEQQRSNLKNRIIEIIKSNANVDKEVITFSD